MIFFSLLSSALIRYMNFPLTSFRRWKVLNYFFCVSVSRGRKRERAKKISCIFVSVRQCKPFIQIIYSYDPRYIISDLNFSGKNSARFFFRQGRWNVRKTVQKSVLMLDVWRYLLIFTRRYFLYLKLIINYVLHFFSGCCCCCCCSFAFKSEYYILFSMNIQFSFGRNMNNA